MLSMLKTATFRRCVCLSGARECVCLVPASRGFSMGRCTRVEIFMAGCCGRMERNEIDSNGHE